ncbi:MAG: SDR family NAD(P)-dependent oxidoreductase [Lachnospiraceae bacterium]
MERLNNKVAIITGATSGIGKEMAILFAEEGAKVIFSGRREEKGREIEKIIKEAGYEASFFRADSSNHNDLVNLVKYTIDKYGKIDVLCNNAGLLLESDFLKLDLENDFDKTMNLNVKSYIKLMQLVIPYMKRQGKGSIVNTASVGAIQAMPNNVSYSVSKAGVKHLTESVAVIYAKDNIRVNSILPGLTYSEMVEKDSDFDKGVRDLIPLGRGAEPKEIAYGALFYASDESGFCTGSSLLMDGGMMLM